jgi:hypothetical protein
MNKKICLNKSLFLVILIAIFVVISFYSINRIINNTLPYQSSAKTIATPTPVKLMNKNALYLGPGIAKLILTNNMEFKVWLPQSDFDKTESELMWIFKDFENNLKNQSPSNKSPFNIGFGLDIKSIGNKIYSLSSKEKNVPEKATFGADAINIIKKNQYLIIHEIRFGSPDTWTNPVTMLVWGKYPKNITNLETKQGLFVVSFTRSSITLIDNITSIIPNNNLHQLIDPVLIRVSKTSALTSTESYLQSVILPIKYSNEYQNSLPTYNTYQNLQNIWNSHKGYCSLDEYECWAQWYVKTYYPITTLKEQEDIKYTDISSYYLPFASEFQLNGLTQLKSGEILALLHLFSIGENYLKRSDIPDTLFFYAKKLNQDKKSFYDIILNDLPNFLWVSYEDVQTNIIK